MTAPRNLETNLERIEGFLAAIGERHRFDELIERLADQVIPLLERTPGVGVRLSLSAVADDSRDVLARALVLLKSDELRKLVLGDFVLLYLINGRNVRLLAVRHHREQGFRFSHGT